MPSSGSLSSPRYVIISSFYLISELHRLEFAQLFFPEIQLSAGRIAKGEEPLTFLLLQLPQDGPAAMAAAVEGSQTGVFGPLIARPPQEEEEEPVMETDVNSGELSRKRPVPGSDGAQAPVNGSQPKRPRLSNGYENGVDAATPMDIDHPQGENNNHAYPSPFEGEQAQTPAPRTDGPEQATQIDKVTELATETTYILLSDDGDASTAATALSSSAASGPASDGAAVGASASTASSRGLPILLNCEWSPREAPVLAAVGTDALARVWNTSRVTSADPVPNHVNGSIVGNLIPDDVTEATLFTSLAWNADGTAIAVASETGRQAKISIWDNTCNYIQGFVLNESPVIKLKWNPDNASVLSISPENKDILITVLQTVTGVQISHVLKSLESTEPTELDAAWVDTNEFLICGGEVLKCFKCSENSIFESRKFETREEEGFSQVLFDARSNLAATASDKGCIDVSFARSSSSAAWIHSACKQGNTHICMHLKADARLCRFGTATACDGPSRHTSVPSQRWSGNHSPTRNHSCQTTSA